MSLLLVGLLGGLVTGISPCILPVLPVIFLASGSEGSSRRRPFLVVAGLVVSFSAFTVLGALVLRALHLPSGVIRWAGLVALVLLGLGMIVPRFESVLERPFARLPQRQVRPDRGGFLLGLALGAVFVPCAGPVLAAITVAGATGDIDSATVGLTLAFAVGVAVPLLALALTGRGLVARIRGLRGRLHAVRVASGVVLIAVAVALTFNVTDAVSRTVPDYTARLDTTVGTGLAKAKAKAPGAGKAEALSACQAAAGGAALRNCGPAPEIRGIDAWLNTPGGSAVTLAATKGDVVLVDFWAYSCINCQRAIAHVTAWDEAYRAAGLRVIGVHTPEYAFEHQAGNVAAGAERLGITYPVALDNDYATWKAYGNDSWPADYLIDARGVVRQVTVGEGDYARTEQQIRTLLAERTATLPAPTRVQDRTPASAAQTPETYLGAARATNFAGGASTTDPTSFHVPAALPPSSFALDGHWKVTAESVTAVSGAHIRLDFRARQVYLDVGGTGTVTATIDGRTRRYAISGAPDIHALLDPTMSPGGILDVTVSPGLSAYSFTFG